MRPRTAFRALLLALLTAAPAGAGTITGGFLYAPPGTAGAFVIAAATLDMAGDVPGGLGPLAFSFTIEPSGGAAPYDFTFRNDGAAAVLVLGAEVGTADATSMIRAVVAAGQTFAWPGVTVHEPAHDGDPAFFDVKVTDAPEPASIALALLGAPALALLRRRGRCGDGGENVCDPPAVGFHNTPVVFGADQLDDDRL